jgi:hypothetical protein
MKKRSLYLVSRGLLLLINPLEKDYEGTYCNTVFVDESMYKAHHNYASAFQAFHMPYLLLGLSTAG